MCVIAWGGDRPSSWFRTHRQRCNPRSMARQGTPSRSTLKPCSLANSSPSPDCRCTIPRQHPRSSTILPTCSPLNKLFIQRKTSRPTKASRRLRRRHHSCIPPAVRCLPYQSSSRKKETEGTYHACWIGPGVTKVSFAARITGQSIGNRRCGFVLNRGTLC